MTVAGRFADGSIRDLTAEATFRVLNDRIARVNEQGVVSPVKDGRTEIVVAVAGRETRVPAEVLQAERTRATSYRLDVVPLLSKAGCNMGACHGNLNGKGGFRLSLRGDDPAFDVASLTRDAFNRRLDLFRPENSLFLLKPTGRVPHEGGLRFPIDSVEAKTLASWIASGAKDDVLDAPKVVKLSVFPSERLNAAPCLSQQLIVTAELSDGSVRDVTRQASYDVNDPTKAGVSLDGRVETSGPGEVVVAVRYQTGRAISRLAFLADRPRFVWKAPPAANVVDRLVFAKLKSLKINPSPLADDSTFVRRAYLDALGVLPSADEAREFVADRDPAKRAKLVDRLLTRPEFADHWSLKWADLLRNEEKTMGDKGTWVFQRWLRDRIAGDEPLDEFARSILTARGSTWKNPAASFYRTNRDPSTAAETVAQVFLGVRLQCARCHNHPFDVWTQDDYYHLAAYFANLSRKRSNNYQQDKFDKHEITGDEIVYLSGRPRMVQPRTGLMMEPKPPAGPAPALSEDPNALDDLAEWLTRDNPQFARNMANRVWYHLLGRGIVDPVDDFRDSNPPTNPALLDALTSELIEGGMRLRPLVGLIMKSRVYGLDSHPNETNAEDEANFSRAAIRLLPAEALLDALGQVLGIPERFRNAPLGLRAEQMPGVQTGTDFLKIFGKPDRLLTCECERSDSTTLAQALQLMNGASIQNKLRDPDNRLGAALRRQRSDGEILAELYWSSLSRAPTAMETSAAVDYVSKAKNRRLAWEDIAWAIVNSKEFLLRH